MKKTTRGTTTMAALLAGGCAAGPLFDQECVGGTAAGFPCWNVDLAAFLPTDSIGGGDLSSVWGWTDEDSAREFAIVGRRSGTAFVEVTRPDRPVYVAELPAPGLPVFGESAWREMTVAFDHAYIVSEAFDHALRIVDLKQLLELDEFPTTLQDTAVYTDGPPDPPPAADIASTHHPERSVQVQGQDGQLSSTHTIFAHPTTGFLFLYGSNTCNGGPHMVDVRDPPNPKFAGCAAEHGYTHDGLCVLYEGSDPDHQGREICLLSNGEIFNPETPRASRLVVVDVTDKAAPMTIAVAEYPHAAYAHQGALTADQRYFLMDDEFDEIAHSRNTSTRIWDLADLDAPLYLGEHVHEGRAIDHNQFIKDGLVFQANYRAGLRVQDLAGVADASLEEIAYFDVYPDDDEPYFDGAWNNYPFFPSGTVVVSSIEAGLFVVRPRLP